MGKRRRTERVRASRRKEMEIIVPEMEEIAKTYRPPFQWTEERIAILRRYSGRVPQWKLAEFLSCGRDTLRKKQKMMVLR